MRHGTNRVISRRCSLRHFNLNASTMSPLFFSFFFVCTQEFMVIFMTTMRVATVRVACVSVVLTINLPTTIYCAQPDINVELAL